MSSLEADFAPETTNLPCKQTRKSPELPQFRVYQDENFRAYRAKPSGQNESTSSLIGRKINNICSNIAVEIPFDPKFHSISVETSPKRALREPLASLSSIALNGAKRAPEVPEECLKNQTNDHTSTFFSVF